MKFMDICLDCLGILGETERKEGLNMDSEESYVQVDTFICKVDLHSKFLFTKGVW